MLPDISLQDIIFRIRSHNLRVRGHSGSLTDHLCSAILHTWEGGGGQRKMRIPKTRMTPLEVDFRNLYKVLHSVG